MADDTGGKPSRQELEQALLQLEAGKRRLDAMGKQSQMIEGNIADVNMTISALNALEDAVEGNEVLVPVGANTYVKAGLLDKETILVGVGAGVSVEKQRPEAVETLKKRRGEFYKALEEIQKASSSLAGQLNELNAMAEQMASQMKVE